MEFRRVRLKLRIPFDQRTADGSIPPASSQHAPSHPEPQTHTPIAHRHLVVENSMFGSATIEPLQREVVKTEIDHAKWLVWHGKGGKSVARIKALDTSLLAKQGYEGSTLWWNLRRLYLYMDNNAGTLVN
jgi:hypothetical protein